MRETPQTFGNLRHRLCGIEPAEGGRQPDEHERLCCEDVVLARLIDHTDLAMSSGFPIRQNAVDLPSLQRGGICGVVDADGEPGPASPAFGRTNVAPPS